MSNHLSSLLEEWCWAKNTTQWVLVTVYKTEGSAYRKAGAMMLINGAGRQFGLLSGGCLEADIVRNARKVMAMGRSLTLVYDGSDEDDLSFQLGIGCGGKVYIMLQPITADNDLGLEAMAQALRERRSGTYYQKIGDVEAHFKPDEQRQLSRSTIEGEWLISPITPEPHVLVVGGGADARPVVAMANELGWRVTLADSRPANARDEYFPKADTILRDMGEKMTNFVQDQKVDAAVLMSHSIAMDGESLKRLQGTDLKHIALLGPRHRYFQVLERAGLREQDLTCAVSGPAGLEIGGQLPESIALSILAQCHQILHARQGVQDQVMAAQ